jgi:hypothetical protein
MRTKIIAVNAIIVAIVGLLAFFIVRSSLGNALSNSSSQSARATQDATTAAAKLQLGALQLERWLTAKAQEGATQEVISRATAEARGNAATALCDRLASEAKSLSFTPAIVSVIDLNGKFVGRNGSSLLRGEDAASTSPSRLRSHGALPAQTCGSTKSATINTSCLMRRFETLPTRLLVCLLSV